MESCKPCRTLVGILELTVLAEDEDEILPITNEEFFKDENADMYCKEGLATVGHTTFLLDIDTDGVLMRRAPLDGALQKVVPVTLRARVLYVSYYPRHPGHHGESRVYFTIR